MRGLAEQLVDYVHKHLPQESGELAYAQKVAAAVEHKRAGWGITTAEASWIRKELLRRFARE